MGPHRPGRSADALSSMLLSAPQGDEGTASSRCGSGVRSLDWGTRVGV